MRGPTLPTIAKRVYLVVLTALLAEFLVPSPGEAFYLMEGSILLGGALALFILWKARQETDIHVLREGAIAGAGSFGGVISLSLWMAFDYTPTLPLAIAMLAGGLVFYVRASEADNARRLPVTTPAVEVEPGIAEAVTQNLLESSWLHGYTVRILEAIAILNRHTAQTYDSSLLDRIRTALPSELYELMKYTFLSGEGFVQQAFVNGYQAGGDSVIEYLVTYIENGTAVSIAITGIVDELMLRISPPAKPAEPLIERAAQENDT